MTIATCGVLTISDKGSRGEREDSSGAQLKKILANSNFSVIAYKIVPDQQDIISKMLIHWSDDLNIDLIITTGGTGVDPLDVTPEATQKVIEREVPGLSEAMRQASFQKTVNAVWSRGIAGIRKKSLIINLPGSEKAARENLKTILAALPHGIYKIKGGKGECGESGEKSIF